MRFNARSQQVGLDWLAPIRAQIEPRRIGLDNQLEFADTKPAFELFLASDRRSKGCKALKVDKAVDVVLCCVTTRIFFLFVLPNTDFELGSDADVKLLETVSEYVDVSVFVQATPFVLLSLLFISGTTSPSS